MSYDLATIMITITTFQLIVSTIAGQLGTPPELQDSASSNIVRVKSLKLQSPTSITAIPYHYYKLKQWAQ